MVNGKLTHVFVIAIHLYPIPLFPYFPISLFPHFPIPLLPFFVTLSEVEGPQFPYFSSPKP